MPAIEVGRVCVKLNGKDVGKKCVIIDVIDKTYVLYTGPKSVTGIKKRRVNMNHLEALDIKLEIKRGASDEEVANALKAAGILEEMKLPSKPIF